MIGDRLICVAAAMGLINGREYEITAEAIGGKYLAVKDVKTGYPLSGITASEQPGFHPTRFRPVEPPKRSIVVSKAGSVYEIETSPDRWRYLRSNISGGREAWREGVPNMASGEQARVEIPR